MEIIGIVCEYNPFHNGHIYQIKKIKEKYPDSLLIVAMSGNFTQRGIPSIIDKWKKTELALTYGIDLVIEIPFSFCTQSSDIYAKGAINILYNAGVNRLIFGSESNNIEMLEECADIQLNNDNYNTLVKELLDEGLNYPTAMSKALEKISNITISDSNDLLGLSYIKEIKRNNYNIKYESIKRTNSYTSKDLNGNISSATSIREAIKNNIDISDSVPIELSKYLNDTLYFDDYFDYIKYKIITENDLDKYLDVSEGIENKLKSEIDNSDSLEEFIDKIKTKRYTYNKIQRMLTHILFNFTKEDKELYNEIPYLRILGFNELGQKHLNTIKKDCKLPILTKFKSNNKYLDLELKTTKIYSLPLSKEYRDYIIKKEIESFPIINNVN